MTKTTNDATEMLRSPYFFREVLSAARKVGLVGEERNALVVYTTATSRLLAKPLCLFIKGPSSVGKNFLADSILSLLPPTEIHLLTSASTRSWNYLGGDIAHKTVYVKERNESAGVVQPSRLLISENALSHSVAVRQGGRFVQETCVTKGPIASISTTTKDRVEIDDETRHVSVWVDESCEQTTDIMKAALDTGSGLSPDELAVWHEVQELLKQRSNVAITFPDTFRGIVDHVRNDNLWARRYFPAFLQSCRTVALIRSFRDDKGKADIPRGLVVSFKDFAIAALIFNAVFSRSLNKADDQDIEVEQRIKRIAARTGGNGVRASDLAHDMGTSADRAYALLRKAAGAGTVSRINTPSKGNLKLYLPGRPTRFLPHPADMFNRLAGVPKKVKFVHPLTGEWIIYNR